MWQILTRNSLRAWAFAITCLYCYTYVVATYSYQSGFACRDNIWLGEVVTDASAKNSHTPRTGAVPSISNRYQSCSQSDIENALNSVSQLQ